MRRLARRTLHKKETKGVFPSVSFFESDRRVAERNAFKNRERGVKRLAFRRFHRLLFSWVIFPTKKKV